MFKFGEKALFVENWPMVDDNASIYDFNKARAFHRGQEYFTLGSTELKVLVINDKGELDLVPFFAVQNTHKIAYWKAFKWWLKIMFVHWGITKSHGRFATDRILYEDNKKPREIPQIFYIGERLRLKGDYSLADWGASYHKGDVFPTLGIYRGKNITDKKTTNLNSFLNTDDIAFTEPRALIVNSLGQFDLIPLSYIESTKTYDLFFALKYYVIMGWNKLNGKHTTTNN